MKVTDLLNSVKEIETEVSEINADLVALENEDIKINEEMDNITRQVQFFKTDSNTWQNAIEQCILSSTNGGTISFPYGKDIEILTDIEIPLNTKVLGNKCNLKYKGSSIYLPSIKINESNIEVSDLILDKVVFSIGTNSKDQENIYIHHNIINNYNRAIHNYCKDRKIKNLKIEYNECYNQLDETQVYQPFCAIGFHGDNVTIENCYIRNNVVDRTNGFGIQFYLGGNSSYKDTFVEQNKITNTGVNRPLSSNSFAGTGGIYSGNNLTYTGVIVRDNYLKNINEVGIEGQFEEVSNNRIENTGCNAKDRFIGDNSGIYGSSKFVFNNTIINAGDNGGMWIYAPSKVTKELTYVGNTVINNYKVWQPSTNYNTEDLLECGDFVYRVVVAGTSGATQPSDENITIDGTLQIEYVKKTNKRGLHLNSPQGYNSLILLNNTFNNIEQPFSTFGKADKISFGNNAKNGRNGNFIWHGVNNVFLDEDLTVSNHYDKFFDCYFNEKDSTDETKLVLPTGVQVKNGVYTIVKDSSGYRDVMKINNTDGTYRSRLYIPLYFPFVSNILVNIRFRSNNGLGLRVFKNGAYLSEHSIAIEDENVHTFKYMSNSANKLELEFYSKNYTISDGSQYIIIESIEVINLK